MDIALVGVIATFIAFRLVGMTTGREAKAPLNQGKFLAHLGVLGLLFGDCVVSGFLVSSAGRDRERQARLVGLLGESGWLLQEGRVTEEAAAAEEAIRLRERARGFLPGRP